MHARRHARTYARMHAHTHTHTHTHTHIHARTHARTHARMQACTHTYVRTNTHTHTNKQTNTRVCVCVCVLNVHHHGHSLLTPKPSQRTPLFRSYQHTRHPCCVLDSPQDFPCVTFPLLLSPIKSGSILLGKTLSQLRVPCAVIAVLPQCQTTPRFSILSRPLRLALLEHFALTEKW